MSRAGSQTAARFWDRADRTGGEDACWPWLASRDQHGYGRVWWTIDGRSGMWVAARIAYMLANGAWPAASHVLHSCDNPPCCNPRHLRLGTPADNHADMVLRGRTTKGAAGLAGEANPNARLTEAMALEVLRRLALGEAKIAIARELKISRATVIFISQGKRWAHLKGGR